MNLYKAVFWSVILALAVILPVVNLWAINALFSLEIPLTWRTYLAAFVLTGYLINWGGSKK